MLENYIINRMLYYVVLPNVLLVTQMLDISALSLSLSDQKGPYYTDITLLQKGYRGYKAIT